MMQYVQYDNISVRKKRKAVKNYGLYLLSPLSSKFCFYNKYISLGYYEEFT